MIKDPFLYESFYDLINRKSLIKEDVTEKKLTSFSYINFGFSDIDSIEGIEKCINLESLFLMGNNIKDISPLQPLKRLKVLDLSMNESIDFSTLSEPMPSVVRLCLRSCNLENTSFLKWFPNLKDLSLQDNDIPLLGDIIALENLQSLEMIGNPISEEEVVDFMNAKAIDVFRYLHPTT